MKKILVTGSNGFIGKNTLVALYEHKEYEIITINRENSEQELKNAVLTADFIVHLAGINRPSNIKEFYEGNCGLTKKIVEYLKNSNKKTPIIITSSIQSLLDNDYGKSKKKSEEILVNYSDECNANIYILRLPNVFGKWCKPNYNSVVATFCYNISHNKEIFIKSPDIELTLVYIDDVVKSILYLINNDFKSKYIKTDLINNNEFIIKLDDYYYEIVNTYQKKLQYIADILTNFKTMKDTLLIPNLNDKFEKALYSTYLTYLDENKLSYFLEKKKDNRGSLSEVLKSCSFGQIFISTTNENVIRGNHWHHSKTEKFIVIKGVALIKLRKINESNIIEYKVDGNNIQIVDIPPGYTHSIQNIGDDELITIFWSNEVFDPQQPDTYFLEVEKNEQT